MKNTAIKLGKNLGVTLLVPAAVYGLVLLICLAFGATGFGVGSDWHNILLNTIYSGLIALAMSYNLTSGRFDFSLGSVLILTTIISGTIASRYPIGPLGMLAVAVAGGAVLGAISGLIYVWLRLPPMIVSLGIAMIYEAAGFILNGGAGVKLIGRNDLLIFAREPGSFIVMAVVLIVLVYLLNFTKFGYNTRSLSTGQKNAVDVGINEKRNAVACYVIAGVLMAIAGCIYISQYGTIAPSTGLSSSSFIMGAFLPMFLGGALARYSDRNIGVVVGAFIQACITSGFAKLGLSSSLQSVLNGVIVLSFLVYASNQYKIFEFKMHKQKKQEALKDMAQA